MRGTKLAISIAGAALGLALPASASAEELTVPWTVDGGLSAQGQAPNSPPPARTTGTASSAEHPQPVVLVHGLPANRTVNWSTMSPFLANRGFCVFALTYGNRANVDSARLPARRAQADAGQRRAPGPLRRQGPRRHRRAQGRHRRPLRGQPDAQLLGQVHGRRQGRRRLRRRHAAVGRHRPRRPRQHRPRSARRSASPASPTTRSSPSASPATSSSTTRSSSPR